MDLIARALGLEPTEVRRRNMIRPDEMPCPMILVANSGAAGAQHDSGQDCFLQQ